VENGAEEAKFPHSILAPLKIEETLMGEELSH